MLYIPFGVPQKSILGPFLLTMYSKALSLMAQMHGVNIHMYADDIQPLVHVHMKSKLNSEQDRSDAVGRLDRLMISEAARQC